MEFRALATRMTQRLSMAAEIVPVERPEPVIPEIPPFTAPRTYALVDTVEGLDHWIEAAQQAGTVAIWPEGSSVASTRPALCGIALAWRPASPPMSRCGHRAPEAEAALPATDGRECPTCIAPLPHCGRGCRAQRGG